MRLSTSSQGDANNARFGLMLVDNAVEITLHHLALDAEQEARSRRYRDRAYEHAGELKAALGRNFGPKLKFAKALGALDAETVQTIGITHKFRNEVYHVGPHHEAILGPLSQFHFQVWRPRFSGSTRQGGSVIRFERSSHPGQEGTSARGSVSTKRWNAIAWRANPSVRERSRV